MKVPVTNTVLPPSVHVKVVKTSDELRMGTSVFVGLLVLPLQVAGRRLGRVDEVNSAPWIDTALALLRISHNFATMFEIIILVVRE